MDGHVLTDDIVVDYKKSDKDDCLHFLTHLENVSGKSLSALISPSAKRIYTSCFNAWFLKKNFDVKHIDVHGFETNKSFKITFKGNKYIYSLLDSKFSTGSVALLLHGPFGTYLYTGNFCYYPSFVRSPVLIPVIEEKALTRLYLDNTYYEKPSSFLGFESIVNRIVTLIRSEQNKKFYMYADKGTMEPLIAEIAYKLKEKVYVCQSTMEIMKVLGYEEFFTRNSFESRVFIDKAYLKKRGYETDNIIIHLNRISAAEDCFHSIEKKGNVYNIYFYCRSNHTEVCELLNMLKPESITFLFTDLDKSKITFNLEFKNGFSQPQVFNSRPDLSLINSQGVADQTQVPMQIIKFSTINFNSKIGINDAKSNETNTQQIPEHQDSNDTNKVFTNKCSLRVRKVLEINNCGLSAEALPLCDDSNSNQDIQSDVSNEDLSLKNKDVPSVNEKNKPTVYNIPIHSVPQDLHNYSKRKPQNNLQQTLGNSSAVSNTFTNDGKLSSVVAETIIGAPLVMKSKLVKDDRIITPNMVKISKVPVVSKDKNYSVLSSNRYTNSKKSIFLKAPVYESPCMNKNSGLKSMEIGKLSIKKKPMSLLANAKIIDPQSTNKKRHTSLLQPQKNTLNLSTLFQGWMENNLNESTISSLNSESIPEEEEVLKSDDSFKVLIPRQSKASLDINIGPNNSIDSDTTLKNDATKELSDNSVRSETCSEVPTTSNYVVCNQKNDDVIQNNFCMEKVILSENNKIPSNIVQCSISRELPSSNEKKALLDEGNDKNEETYFKNNEVVMNKFKRGISPTETESMINSRKKLRSDSFRICLLQPQFYKDAEKVSLNPCHVRIKRNSYEKTYFFSPHHDCHLPKFFGFKKHEIKPRHELLHLRSLEKLIRELS